MIFESTEPAGKIVDALFESMEKESPAYTFTTTGLLWQLIGYILEHKPNRKSEIPSSLYKKNKQIKRVLTKIRNDYSSQLTLETLALEAKLNPRYLCRAFKEATGRTPINYLNYYRIECAAEQLCISYISVTEIALSCGFSDISYFNRLFKRQKGVSPSAYRKRLKQ